MTYQLKEIDKIEIVALMDNASDPFTVSHENLRWNEVEYQFKINKRRTFCGADLCRACTGLSLLIRVYVDERKYTVLFDTGPDSGLVVENAHRLGFSLDEIDAIVISHGHFDHYGGLISVLDVVEKKDIPVYIHPDLFAPRAFDLCNGEKILDSYLLTKEKIEEHGGKIIESKNPVLLAEGVGLISGEIPRVNSYELGVPHELRMMNGKWEEAPLVIDERILIFNLKNKGLCLFTGCGHIGVINASHAAKNLIKNEKIHILMGGFHLAGPAFENRINPTLDDLIKINPDYIITGHCTGAKAQSALTSAFGDKHIPYGVATVFKF